MFSHTTSILVGSSFSKGFLALSSGEVVYHYQQILSPRQWSWHVQGYLAMLCQVTLWA